MKKYISLTGLYSLSHLLVDFSCAFLIFRELSGSAEWLMCLLLYNFFAFAMQMPLGVVADSLDKNRIIAVFGCVLVLISPLFSSISLLFSSVAGLGNALFHIGAGRDIILVSKNRFSALGIFVSPGTVGLFLGTLLGKSSSFPLLAVLALLLASTALIYFAVPKLYDTSEITSEASLPQNQKNTTFIFMIACLFLVVYLRSYVGMTLSFPWKGEGSSAVMLLIAVFLGKASGGILADRFGAIKTSFISLTLCAVLFLFYRIPFFGITAVLLFNMTMPITLGAVVRRMPERLGFGFGLLTFGLFLGLIPILIGTPSFLTMPYGYTAACMISAILLYYGLKEPKYATV